MNDDAVAWLGVLAIVLLTVSISAFAIFDVEYDRSLALLRACRQRRRLVNERAASLVVMGYAKQSALLLASAALEEEAEANARAVEAVMR